MRSKDLRIGLLALFLHPCYASLGYGSMPRDEAAAKDEAAEHDQASTASDAFDCMEDLSSFADTWSAKKEAWCCANKGLGCAGDSPTASPTAPGLLTVAPLTGTTGAVAVTSTAAPVGGATDGGATSSAAEESTTEKAEESTTKEESTTIAASAEEAVASGNTGAVTDHLLASLDSEDSSTSIPFYSAPTLPPPMFCHENNTMYEPIDLNYSASATVLDNIEDCQLLCRAVEECGFFSWYPDLKLCHMARPTAQKKTSRVGFQGGPASCGEAQQAASGDTAEASLMMKTCMLTNISFDPKSSRGRDSTYESDEVQCQSACAETDWCAHFVYNTLTKTCDLQDNESVPTYALAYEVVGPPDCSVTVYLNATVRGKKGENLVDLGQDAFVGFVGLVEAAIIKYVGNFTPFENGKQGASIPLIDKDDVDVKLHLGGRNDSEPITYITKVRMTFEMKFKKSQRALYVATLFNGSFSTTKLNDQVESFLLAYGDNYNVDESVNINRLEVSELSSVEMVSTAANFVETVASEYKEKTGLSEDLNAHLWQTSKPTAPVALSVIGVSMSLLALSYGFQRYQRQRCYPAPGTRDAYVTVDAYATEDAMRELSAPLDFDTDGMGLSPLDAEHEHHVV